MTRIRQHELFGWCCFWLGIGLIIGALGLKW
jgi:hypothetical protein